MRQILVFVGHVLGREGPDTFLGETRGSVDVARGFRWEGSSLALVGLPPPISHNCKF